MILHAPLVLSLVAALAGPRVAAVPPDESGRRPYTVFALRLEKVINAQDRKALVALFDQTAFIDRVVRGVTRPDDFRARFGDQFKRTGTRIIGEFVDVVRNGGACKFLRVRRVNGEYRAVFRVLIDNGLNYADFILTPARDSGPKIADLYMAVTGELSSQTAARVAVNVMRELRGKAVGVEIRDGLLDNMAAVRQFMALVREKQPEKALKAWAKLPAKLKREKFVAVLRVMAASSLMDDDPAGYQAAIDDFLKHFPNDSAADLIGLDGLYLRKKYADCHRTLDRINRAVGGDPYLNVYHGCISLMEKKPAAARRSAELALDAEPDLVPAYAVLMQAAAIGKNYPEATRLLALLTTKYQCDANELTADPAYAEYLKSPEYKTWAASRKKKK